MSLSVARDRWSFAGRLITAAAGYFVLVFATGFVLGAFRTLWVAQQVGEQRAELLEMPLMLVAIFYAASWATRRLVPPHTLGIRLTLGCAALLFLMTTELSGAVWLRHQTIQSYLAGRETVAGAIYFLMLGVFALMPALVEKEDGKSRLAA